MPEHMALSVPPGKPLGAWHGAGSEGTAVPYPARPAPRGSGRWPREPAARTGGAGSGGTRCGVEAWAGRNLGMQKITAEHPAQRDPLPTITTCPPPRSGLGSVLPPSAVHRGPSPRVGLEGESAQQLTYFTGKSSHCAPPPQTCPLPYHRLDPPHLPGGQLLFSFS